jgi:hypothetical protein
MRLFTKPLTSPLIKIAMSPSLRRTVATGAFS